MSTALIGHDEAIRQATAAFASGRMHHAWLIAGIEGIGKSTLALHIAHHILSQGRSPVKIIDASLPTAKLIAAGAHPDMLTIGRSRDEKSGELKSLITIDDALKIGAFLRRTSTEGGWRAVIIDEAHLLNRFGQNAILKTLEEPPPRTVILLTVTTPGALLPTIRSRCRLLSLAPLDAAAIKTILFQTVSGPITDEDRVVARAKGSAGLALKILRTQALPLFDELCAVLDKRPLDIQRLHKLADQVSRKADAESFEILTGLFEDHIDEMIRSAARAGASGEASQLLDTRDKVRQILTAADTSNLDHRLAFINAVAAMQAA